MPREPLRLTDSVLAAYRPGALVAVAVGAPAGIPRRRPTPYAVRSSAMASLASSQGTVTAPGSETAIIPVRGALVQRASWYDCGEPCAYDTIEADILGALSDPGVGQGLLDVDSPGGDVPGLEQAVLRIRAGVERLGKPLIGYVNEFCASAATWLMLGICDAVYCPPSGRIGAIGSCVIFGTNARRIVKDGTDIYIGRDPGGKMNPNPMEPLDDVGRARIDRLAAEGAARFYARIAAGYPSRPEGIPETIVRGWNADLFTGAAAFGAGLVNGVCSMNEAIALAESWPRSEAA